MNHEPWVKDLVRPLTVGAMMGCIALSLVRLVQLFFPHWRGGFMVAGCVAAAVEANYSYRLIRSRRLSGSDLVRFRVVEAFLFLILLRVGAYVGEPWTEVIREVRAWPRDPRLILSFEVVYAFALVLSSWSTSTQTTYDFERIGEPPVRDKYYVSPFDALVHRFFSGGAVVLLASGLTRIGIADLLDLDRPPVPGLILNVLIYFVLGFLMLGQIQLTRLSGRWQREGMTLPTGLTGHWIRYTLILLALAGVIAFALPTAYTIPLLDIAAIVIQVVFYVFHVIFQLVILLMFLLLIPLLRLLGLDVPDRQPEVIPPPNLDRLTPDTPTSAGAPPWLEIVRSLLFWAVASIAVLYVVRSYLRDRPELWAALSRFRVFPALRRLTRALWDRLTGLAVAVGLRIPRRIRLPGLRREEEGAGGANPSRSFRPDALSRRERTLYYYLSVLRRAAEQGYPRRVSQTPYEYDADLGSDLPEIELELDKLTEAFVEVRYSDHEIDSEREGGVRSAWRRIRRMLRSLGRADEAGEVTYRKETE